MKLVRTKNISPLKARALMSVSTVLRKLDGKTERKKKTKEKEKNWKTA
jgi:hypothetical protein